MKRWTRRWGPSIALLLLAFLLRVWRLGDQSLWYDEAYLWWATTEVSFSKMLALSVREIVPPGHYVLLRGWAPLAGTTEFALRAPSALLGVLGVAAAGRLVGRLTSSNVGI
jgi:predicted membrane-bound mannosyltransferase